MSPRVLSLRRILADHRTNVSLSCAERNVEYHSSIDENSSHQEIRLHKGRSSGHCKICGLDPKHAVVGQIGQFLADRMLKSHSDIIPSGERNALRQFWTCEKQEI